MEQSEKSFQTPQENDEEKLFSYENIQIKESMYIEMRSQMEEELLGVFNREVYSNDNRDEKQVQKDILEDLENNQESNTTEEQETENQSFSQGVFSPLSQNTNNQSTNRKSKKVDDQNEIVDVSEEQDFLYFAKQNLKEQAQLKTTKTNKYAPNKEDQINGYFKNQISVADNKKWDKESYFTCTNLNQSFKTSDIYMKEYQIIKQEKDKAQKHQVAVNFLKYNQKQKAFEFHGGILQDVLYNADENSLMLNAVLSKGQAHYYFVKSKTDEQSQKSLILKKVTLGEVSDYSFLETVPQLNFQRQFKVQTIDSIKIELPEDFQFNLEDLDYCFMQNATVNENEQLLDEIPFLKKQFILVRNIVRNPRIGNRAILIYSLDDALKPIIRIDDQNIDEPLISFYTMKNDKQWAFTLFGDKNQYEINYDLKNGVNQKMQENSQLIQKEAFEENYCNSQSRFKRSTFQIEVQSIKIDTKILSRFKDKKKQKTIDQTYFISNSGAIRLIHPIQSMQLIKQLHEVDEVQKKETDYTLIKNIIKEQNYKHNLVEEQTSIFILFFNNKVNYENNKTVLQTIIKFLQQFHKQPDFVSYKQLFCFKDLIVGIRSSWDIDCFSLNQKQFNESFDEKRNNLIKLKSNKTLLNKVLGNFDFKNQQRKKIYQNNYDFSQNQNFSNQFLEPFYINKYKKHVYTTHQKGFVNGKEYIFNPNCLLIDISQQNNEKRDVFKILKLYDQDVKDLKLIKYHTSKNVAIFFFQHRNFDTLNDSQIIETNSNLSGLNFFVIMKIQELKKIVFEKKAIIELDKTIIYIPQNRDGKIFIDQKTYNVQDILSYEEDCNFPNWIQNQIEFEMVRDLGDLANNWLPFIMYNKVLKNRYETFLCILNIEKMGGENKLEYQFQEKIKFNEYLQTFKINYYQSEIEKYKIQDVESDVQDSYRILNQSQIGRHSSLFCRSSDWQQGLFEDNKQLLSARFQIGTNVVIGSNQYCFIDIQEYLVTINTNDHNFKNPDQKFVYESKSLDSDISIQPIQFTHAIRSQGYINQKKVSFATPFENERLIPNIDDEGNISSTLVLLNNVQTKLGILQIVENLQQLKSQCSEEQISLLKSKVGHYVYITKKVNNQIFDGVFSDGQEIQGLNYEITVQFNQLQKSNLKKLPHEQKKLEELYDDFQDQIWEEYVYTLFELNNQYQNDKAQSVKGKLVSQNINQLSFQNQPNNQLYICQTAFNKDIILNKYFNKNESAFWLFHFQKILLSTSLADFGELFSGNQQQILNRYFQPRFVLNGQNICNLDLKNNKNEQRLRQSLSLDFVENEYFDFFENSIAYQSAVTKSGSQQFDLLKIKQVFDFNHFFNLQFDFSNYESIVERTMNQGQQKLLTFIVDYILNNCKHRSFNILLVQDFPYLVFKTQTNINNFFNISEIEEIEIQNVFENKIDKQHFKTPKMQLNNLELMLYDPKLPQFGSFEEDENYKVFQMNTFDGPFYSKDEICHFVLNQEDQSNNESYISANLIPVVYSFINFENIIRKIKIDKILKKQILDKDIIRGDAQDINQIDDLFVATMINQNSCDTEFMTSSTIEKIICFQYQRVQPIIKKLLFTYLLGFAIPFWYLVFEINYLDKNDAESKFFRDCIRIPIQLIACLTQLLFLVFEFANIHFNGLQEYLQDMWNLIDTSQFILFCIHLFMRYFCDQDQLKVYGTLRLFDGILQIVICILVASRILQFIRYNDDYSYLVQMLSQVFSDVIPFLTVFLLYIILFTLVTLIMGADFGDDDYSDLPGFVRVIISIFRTSIGDIQAYDYGEWKDKDKKDETLLLEGESAEDNSDFLRAQSVAISIIWIIWFFNIFFMVIILANFLIAEVSVTFEDVKNLGNVFLNKEKAKFNELIFQIQAYFGIKNEFSVMVFTQSKDFLEHTLQDPQFIQIVETINKNTQNTIKNLQNDIKQLMINKNQKSQADEPQEFDIQEQVQEMRHEIQELKLNQQNFHQDIIQIGISQEKDVLKHLQDLTSQREEDRKLLQKILKQQNVQPERNRDRSMDEIQDPSQFLSNLVVNFDSKVSGEKFDQKELVKKIESRHPFVNVEKKDYRKLTQSASNSRYQSRQRDSSIL